MVFATICMKHNAKQKKSVTNDHMAHSSMYTEMSTLGNLQRQGRLLVASD